MFWGPPDPAARRVVVPVVAPPFRDLTVDPPLPPFGLDAALGDRAPEPTFVADAAWTIVGSMSG